MPFAVAAFRSAMAEHSADPSWRALVERCLAESAWFGKLWNEHEVVTAYPVSAQRFRHPQAGLLRFEHTYLWLAPHSETHLVGYVPANEGTAAKLPRF
ncbi:hypothetical protein AB0C51_08680 [Streptomyces pathocidini]|uniref:MmyB family transcriptional regulator n=1 Tax=Streptomyces pathocidini TaxID=1650571 RepID=UPI0033C79911